ncbi:MAG TPA: XdhC/CoxI family protein [Planctomycetota bacterium]|nr:XdhC/CoxI family protein [Planctomycetota bacterium]
MYTLGSTLWQDIAEAQAQRRLLVIATVVRDSGSVPRRCGAKMLIHPDGATRGTVGGGLFEQRVIRDALAALDGGRSVLRGYSFRPSDERECGRSLTVAARGEHCAVSDAEVADQTFGAICGGRVDVFLEVVMPAERLLIVGGGHCGRALAQAASLLDFSIVIVDDRDEHSKPEDFAFRGVESVLRLTPDFSELPEVDAHTYVVLVSKGFITDTEALRRVIRSPAAYIGMIGSAQKRDTVFEKLRAEGISDELLARVHAPIGLEIGADSPAEIAVSILAEIIRKRRRTKNDE